MRAFSITSRLLGCLLLLGAVAWAAQTPPPGSPAAPPAQATDLPPELALVPSDSNFLIHVKIDRILMHPVTLKLLTRLPPEMLKEMQKEMEPGFPFNTKVSVQELASLTFFGRANGLQDPEALAAQIISFRKPLDRKQQLDKMVPEAVEKKVGGRSYYSAKGNEHSRAGMLHFIDDRRLLLPMDGGLEDEKAIERLFGAVYAKKAPGPLSDFLAQAKDKLVVLGVHLPDALRQDMEQLLGHLPAEYGWVEPLLRLQAASLTVELDQVTKFHFKLRYADSGKAKDAAEGAKHGLKFLDQQLDPVFVELQDWAKKDKSARDMAQAAMVLLQEFQTMLKTAQVQVQDKELAITLSYKTDDAMIAQMARLLTAAWKRERKQEQDRGSLQAIGIAMHNYHADFNHLPPQAICDKNGKPLLSWRVALLPYIGHDELYKKFKLDEPWDSANNKKLLAQMPKLYLPPTVDKDNPNRTYYKVFHSAKGAKTGSVFTDGEKIALEHITAKDGTSLTLMVVEGGDPVPWTKPEDIPFDVDKPLPKLELPFRTGINVVFCDGSVRKFKKGLPEKTLKELITWNGGEKVDFSTLLVEDE